MPTPPDEPKAEPVEQPEQPAAPEPADLQDEMRRVLFDHEMERGMTITRTKQPRRRGRILRG